MRASGEMLATSSIVFDIGERLLIEGFTKCLFGDAVSVKLCVSQQQVVSIGQHEMYI